MKRIALTFIAVLCTLSSQAQLRLSLTEAQDYAVSNNLTVRNTLIDYDKALSKVWETTAQGLPQLSASGNYQHLLTSIPEINFGEQKVKLGLANTFNASGALNQLIFNGSYIVGLQSAKAYKDFAKLGVEKATIEIRAAVAQTYYLCLVTAETRAILHENLTLIEKTLGEMQAMKQQGMVDRTSVDQIEVAYNQLFAQLNSVERQVKNTQDMLKNLIGMPLTQPIELGENLVAIVGAVSDDYLSLTDYKQDENIGIKMAAMDVTLSGLLLKLAQSAYLPTIGAQLGLQHNFTMPEFSFQNATTAYVGASVQVPIFTSGQTAAKVKQARMSLQQSKNKEQQARQDLDLSFQQSLDGFQLAWDVYEVQKKNLALASRVLSDMKKSITVGMKSSTELIQANNSYLEAASGMVTAEFNLLKSKIELDKILSK
ncbi:Outer membrane efflux protein precursor [Mucinivorans hirudinis]|uniref:Outer membrane efflux protein n=1 Tax=Mucinivorans hirudinis TaxID=1433126 RepID=A0A060R7H9_9BACT|nr:Outer membrane efflux protein precursor [Mucinivorans hirudinis]